MFGNYVGPDVISDNWADSPRNYGLYPGGFAPINIETGTVVGTKISAGSPSLSWMFKKTPGTISGTVFEVRFYGPITSTWAGYLLLRQTVRIGETLDNMKTIEEWLEEGRDYTLARATLSGSAGTTISTYNPTTEERIRMAAQLTSIDGQFYKVLDVSCRVIDYLSVGVNISRLRDLPNTCYLSYEFTLIDPSNYERNASHSKPQSEIVYMNSDQGFGEKTIDCNITDFLQCPTSYGDHNGYILSNPPAFTYAMAPMRFLEVPLENKPIQLDTNIYLPRWKYWKKNENNEYIDWRIIGDIFHLRDDEHRITLASYITPTS
jgi:hypothetical protein